MKLIWCSGFPENYAWLEEGSICQIWAQCAFCYIWNLFGVMVFQRAMLDWRRGSVCQIWAQCAFCYIWNLFGVMVFQRSMLNWRRGVCLQNMSTMCILLYMKLIWCNGFPEIYAQLEEGSGVSLSWNLCSVGSSRDLFLIDRGSFCQLWAHFEIYSCFTEVFSTKDQSEQKDQFTLIFLFLFFLLLLFCLLLLH